MSKSYLVTFAKVVLFFETAAKLFGLEQAKENL